MDKDHFSPSSNAIRCAILTVSDSRTPETDGSGRAIRELLLASGHAVNSYAIVPDDRDPIHRRVAEFSNGGECDVVLVTGGTGFAPRDVTVEAVEPLFQRRIEGFGELFRALSYQEIGAAAMLSRAVAGVVGTTAVFVMPGSTAAVRLAMTKLILPQLGHLVGLMRG